MMVCPWCFSTEKKIDEGNKVKIDFPQIFYNF